MVQLRETMIKALVKKFEGQIETHRVNIEILLENTVGVAEHPNILETIEGELEKMSAWEDKLMVLNEYFGSIKHNKPKELLKD
tara:strand:- start:19695 stop:19943 length:249 start_codon:yes stop_codon:yes gene_type:complete